MFKLIASEAPPIRRSSHISTPKTPEISTLLKAYGLDTKTTQTTAIENLEYDLKQSTFCVNSIPTNVFELITTAAISKEAKDVIFVLLAGVLHDHQTKARKEGFNWTDQLLIEEMPYTNHWISNWRHTVEEVLHILVFAEHMGNYTPTDVSKNKPIEQALIASILTDSKKGPGPREVFCHHLNASQFLKESLSGSLKALEIDVEAINKAVLKHQFNPPFIMQIMANILLPESTLSPTQKESKKSLLNKILNPYANPIEDHTIDGVSGYHGVTLTAEEVALLQKIDPRFTGWYLPTQEGDLVATLVAQADAMQYPGSGIIKVMPIRGPGTNFIDATIKTGVNSVLGKGQWASVGASEPLFKTDRATAFYQQLIIAAETQVEDAYTEIRKQLSENPDYTALVEALPKQYQARNEDGLLIQIPFLDTELPIQTVDGKAVYVTEGNEAQFAIALKVRDLFVSIFPEKHRHALNHLYFATHNRRGSVQTDQHPLSPTV